MGRLPSEEAEAAAEAVGVPPYMARLSVFQILLAHPRLARAFNDLLGVLLWDSELDPRLRELAIMRIAWTTGSVYEWTQHWTIATSLGIEEGDLLGVRAWESHAGFSRVDRAMLRATDDVVERGAVTRATWDELEASVRGPDTTKVLLEAVSAIATWRMMSSILQSLEVPLESGAAPWPPDASAPG